jgi:hypothetical protein
VLVRNQGDADVVAVAHEVLGQALKHPEPAFVSVGRPRCGSGKARCGPMGLPACRLVWTTSNILNQRECWHNF